MVISRESALATDTERADFISTLPTRLIDVLELRASEYPENPVIYSAEKTYSYADLVTGMAAAKKVLKNAQVRPGDRVLRKPSPSAFGIPSISRTSFTWKADTSSA